MRQRRLFIMLAFAAATLLSVSCGKDPEDRKDASAGIALLNNGTWGGNDASITIYDPETKSVKANAFYDANSQKLGDLGQDIVRLGDYIYIAMNGSQLIYVTDRELTLQTVIEVNINDVKMSPRSFTTGGGKVYVTFYEGYVGEIDPSNGWETRATTVGPNPEGIAYAGGKLYVANSGGYLYPTYDNTVSVVDVASFKETKRITVNTNPCTVIANASGSKIYVSSLGNYADVPARLQYIDTSSEKVATMDLDNVSAIAYSKDDELLVLCGGYDENWNPLPGTIYSVNAENGKRIGNFSKDNVTISNAYSLTADPASGYVFAGSSDYKTNGDMYIFTSDGALVEKVDTHGINPQKGLML